MLTLESVPFTESDLEAIESFRLVRECRIANPSLHVAPKGDLPRPISETCGNCKHFDRGVCRLKASADWGDSSHVKPTRKACFLGEMHPF
ncbi:hypothetical protein LEP3755_30460 [Leptolyngbya sp. NIES-3755]|nr:hypothetical protein LEP3755_30460 [Leptolyngbya sp. NIES-3755]